MISRLWSGKVYSGIEMARLINDNQNVTLIIENRKGTYLRIMNKCFIALIVIREYEIIIKFYILFSTQNVLSEKNS